MKDAFAMFSDAQAVTATAASTNYLNLGSPNTPPNAPAALKRDIGGGNNQPVQIEVVEAFATLTSLTVSIEVDDNPSFSSPKTVATTGAIAVANLTLGAILPISMVPLGANEQYMRVKYTVAGSSATAGKVTAGLVFGVPSNG